MLWAEPELVKTSRRDEVAELVNSKVLSRQLVKASRHGDVADLVDSKLSSRSRMETAPCGARSCERRRTNFVSIRVWRVGESDS